MVEKKKKKDHESAQAYVKHMCKGEVKIVLPFPLGEKRHNVLVHEIIHVLQYICEDSTIDFVAEMEHMAYIADWLFDAILYDL
ncbi:MAG: hypothetical protein KGL39_32860 [Patescibacteria group bacterium]|nr:hypothetical protein [Patescibacteria group bacterium]